MMSSYSAEHIRDKLQTALTPDHLQVEDMSDGCGMKFSCLIVSSKFEGKPLLQRHRMVNGILEEEMKTVHALAQKTLTPAQWAKQQEQS